MSYVRDETADLAPKYIIENYRRAFKLVYEREPHIRHMFAEWYHVNGETVHKVALFGEITRLRALMQKQRLANTDRGLVQRLIARLRGA
jgi:hypothetical protein